MDKMTNPTLSQTTFNSSTSFNSGGLSDLSLDSCHVHVPIPRHPLARRVEALGTSLDVVPASRGRCSEALPRGGMRQVLWRKTMGNNCKNRLIINYMSK